VSMISTHKPSAEGQNRLAAPSPCLSGNQRETGSGGKFDKLASKIGRGGDILATARLPPRSACPATDERLTAGGRLSKQRESGSEGNAGIDGTLPAAADSGRNIMGERPVCPRFLT
jgi:hypothetical protein